MNVIFFIKKIKAISKIKFEVNFAKNAIHEIGLREENYDRILIGNNFVTDDVLIERNVTPYDFEAFWVTVPQCVILCQILLFFLQITYLLNLDSYIHNFFKKIRNSRAK